MPFTSDGELAPRILPHRLYYAVTKTPQTTIGGDYLSATRVVEFGEAIKNPAYRIPQTEYSGCLDISAHA